MKRRCYKVVSGADREAWLEARRRFITASEAGSVTGTNPFKSAVQLLEDKKNGTTFAGNEHTERGKKHEIDVLRAWSKQNGDAPFRQLSDLLSCYDYPFLGATLDGVGRLNGKSYVLEAKAPAKPWGKKGCPKYYVSQVIVQMLVSGIPRAIVIEGHGHNGYTTCTEHHYALADYQQSDVDAFVEKLRKFHALVVADELPF